MRRIGIVFVVLSALAAGTALAQDVKIGVDDLRKKAAEWKDDSLSTRAGAYADALKEAVAARTRAEEELAGAPEEQKGDLEKRVDDSKARVDALVDRLQAPVEIMDGRDLDATAHKILLTEVTGIVALENVSAEVALGLIDKWINQAKDWLVKNGPGVLFKIFLFLLILFVFKVIAKILGRITKAAVASSKLKISALLRDFFVSIVAKTTFFVGLLIAISTIGIDIGPLLAGVGVLGFVIGFALQGTLSNFAAGIMILLYRPYDVGDAISAAGVTGKVDSMSLVSTTVLTPDNQQVIVPNNSIWGGVITNITANPTRRVDLTVGVGYDDNLDKAQQVLMDIVTSHPKVLDEPEPAVKVANLGESSVDFVVRPWSLTSDYWEVYWDLTKTIKQRLDEEGISIPFPQRDVHVIPNEGEAA
jgi:small conductance mechanosensitive channel